MRVRAYEVLARAVEEGFDHGWRRAHKYADQPTEEAIKEAVINGIMGEICDYFDFEGSNDSEDSR